MPTYRLVESAGTLSRILRGLKMCFLNVLRLHVSQSQRQKRLYKQYMEQLAGAYVERCTDLSTIRWDPRYTYRGPSPEWQYSMACDEYWYSDGSRSCCGTECSDSGRCSSPCCSEVIFNGGQHFSGKRVNSGHVCRRYPVCYPGNFGTKTKCVECTVYLWEHYTIHYVDKRSVVNYSVFYCFLITIFYILTQVHQLELNVEGE